MSRIPFLTPDKLSIEGLQSELTGLLNRWWHRGLSTGPLDGQDWAPAVELRDEPQTYRVIVEIPGVSASAIEVTAQAGGIIIRGDKPAPAASAGRDAEAPVRIVQSERRYGQFSRRVALPGPVQSDAATATFVDGVLDIAVPKAGGPTPVDVPIPVRSGDAPEP